jgi:GAF domain-containing protein
VEETTVVRGFEESNYELEGVSIATRNRRQAQRRIRVRARHKAAVAHLAQCAFEGRDLCSLLDEAVAVVAGTLDVEHCEIMELLPDGKTLLLRAGAGCKKGLVGQARVSATKGSQAAYTLISKYPVIVEDLRTEIRFSGHALRHEHAVASGASVTIPGPRKPFGVMAAYSTRKRKFTNRDARFMQAVAKVIAAAIDRKRAEEVLGKSEKRHRAPETTVAQEVRTGLAQVEVEDERP